MRTRCYLPGMAGLRPRDFSASRSRPSELHGLSEAQKRALLIADNKIAENAGWDFERLAIELPELAELLIAESLDISITGFEPAEIDQLVSDFEDDTADPADDIQTDWLSLYHCPTMSTTRHLLSAARTIHQFAKAGSTKASRRRTAKTATVLQLPASAPVKVEVKERHDSFV